MNATTSSRRSRLSRLSLLAAGIMLASALHAQDATYALNLSAQPLDQALNALAGQTGSRILFATEIAASQQAPALSGELTLQQALQRLLQGTGLSVQETADGSFVIAEPTTSGTALELGSITIQGQGMGEATENSGSYTTGLVSAGSKTPMSLRETPQSVSVVTAQAITDRQITSLGDAMRATPGITVKNANYRSPSYLSRGFEIKNIQVDGAASLDSNGGYSNHLYNMAEYDHIEVLRGTAGLFGGVGDPGGIINLVRKRPMDRYQLKFEASAGSWDNYRSMVDVTGPLAFDGALRGRLVTSYSDRQYFMDNRGTENPMIYGVLEADLSPDTMITVGGRYEKTKERGTGDGLPFYSDGKSPHYSRSDWLTTNWSYSNHAASELFFKLDHYFSDDWKFNTSMTYVRDTVDSQGAFGIYNIDREDGSGPSWEGSYQRAYAEQAVVDMNLSGKFELLGRQHELLVGGDVQNIRARWRAARGMPGRGGSPFEPWPEGTIDKEFLRDYYPSKQRQYGLYSTLRLQLADPLKLIVGARASRYHYEQVYDVKSTTTGEWATENVIDHREATKLVPYGGLVYELNDEWSAYASYSEIFNPQAKYVAGPPAASTSLEPMEGKTYETGLKGELFDGAVNVSAAVFYSERENQAAKDPRYPAMNSVYGGACCFLPRGKVTSKGDRPGSQRRTAAQLAGHGGLYLQPQRRSHPRRDIQRCDTQTPGQAVEHLRATGRVV